MKKSNYTHVAVGVVKNPVGQVLIAKRAQHLHQGGLWEFPGGKVEPQETVEESLCRELMEELGIAVQQAEPLLKIQHQYPDKQVLLDVWQVSTFTGEPTGLQGQPVCWVDIADLYKYSFPQANKKIVSTLLAEFKTLQNEVLVTGGWDGLSDFELKLRRSLDQGIRFVQLRAHSCTDEQYKLLYQSASDICLNYSAQLSANTSVQLFAELGGKALHLTAHRASEITERPVEKSILFGTSCHNLKEIRHAEKLEVDYITLGSLYKTSSHPDVSPMGLDMFAQLVRETSLPVIALGGLNRKNKNVVINAGAYGIACISDFWV